MDSTSVDPATIAARLTPPGPAALATIGVRGPRSLAIVRRMLTPASGSAPFFATDRPHYGLFGGSVRDDVVLRVVATQPIGEVEIHCHGGAAVVASLLDQIAAEGAAIVDWMEYLRHRRASEIHIEAVASLAKASTARCAAILLDQFNGTLEAAFDRVADGDIALAAALLERSSLGLHLTTPWRVALFGRTNVGKSSLLNALVGFGRAITADLPGTTRDVLTADCALDGWPVTLLDGAGFRETDDSLEAEGLTRLAEQLAAVDRRVLIVDLAAPADPINAALATRFRPDLIVGNKRDLALPTWNDRRLAIDLAVSARTSAGVEQLRAMIAQRFVPQCPAIGEPIPFTERQVAWLHDRLAARTVRR